MKVTIINEQDSFTIKSNLIKKIVKFILKEKALKTDEIIIHFVNEKKIIELHSKFFFDSSPTDCISFPIDSINAANGQYHILGECFICTDTAIKYCQKSKKSPFNELLLYIIHSILHLIGYDDIKEKDIKIMKKEEKKIFDLLKIKKYIEP